MSVSSKVRALLTLKGVSNIQLAKHLGISAQAMSNKFYRDSFSAEDLIKIGSFLQCELAFKVDDAQKIVLDANDLRK